MGDVGVFSFGGSKLLSAGRGGAVVTNDNSVAQRIKVFSERGNDSFPLSQLQAAALLPQLEQLEAFTKRRFEAAQFLCEQINQIEGLTTLDLSASQGQDTAKRIENAIYKIPVRVDVGFRDVEAIVANLQANGLPIGTGFRGFFKRSSRRCRKPVELPNSTSAAERTLLMSHPVLLHDRTALELVVRCLREAM